MNERKPNNRPRLVQSTLLIEKKPAVSSTAIAKQMQATRINIDLGLLNVLLLSTVVSSIETWPARQIAQRRHQVRP